MPNYCSNTLVISKATNPQIERIIAAATRQELLNEFLPSPIWENTPNEDGVFPGPRYQRRYFDRAAGRTRTWSTGPMFPDGKTDDRWYYWNNSHWGTKWDPCDIDITREGQDVFISFNTAWSPVSDEWLEALSAAMPQAAISNSFSEPGCDFYGKSEVTDGQANTVVGELSEVRDAWIKENFSEEQYEIYYNEEHEDHETTSELIWDTWYDNEADVIDKAFAECQPSPN